MLVKRYVRLTASALRRELSQRAQRHANAFAHELSYGAVPCVVFHEHGGTHGNFHQAAYRAIQAAPDWSLRLRKSYAAGKWIPRRHDRSRAELDCANSSDALLMNIFCYPGALDAAGLCALLGIERGLRPRFGYKPRLPLIGGRTDQTEIDMSLGSLLVEAKLTETGFQSAREARVLGYCYVEEVFEAAELPRKGDLIQSYQLIRGILAAHHTGQSFIVFCDGRRADLMECWFQVLRTVRSCDLRNRLALVTWQEIAATLPLQLQYFLDSKYGICPA